ncbi:MAG: hypothetical protein KDD53_03340, partial [Bdellovibrionales bacterium]|nr:hypothetical protein [Bdellovibrionales bacterium]
DKSPRINTTQIITPPQMRMPESNKFVDEMVGWFDEAKNSEQLLSDLLQKLIDEGPFVRTALIVVSKERDNAIVVASRGPDIGNGQKLVLDDPLSPLAKCFSKVQSFGSSRSTSSPWGSKAFALSPIDVDHSTPVALYADCGDERGLPFEARRIFRNMVDLLNQKLPQIPGGIPVEI